MVRIVIEDLPILEELTREEMASIIGGTTVDDPDLGGTNGLPKPPTGDVGS